MVAAIARGSDGLRGIALADGVFSLRLRELRDAAGWTQAELASRSGVSERAVAQWERGIRQPSWEHVIALADALGVSTEAFRQEPTPPIPEKRKPGRPRKPPSEGEAPPAAGAEPAGEPQGEPSGEKAKKRPRKK